MTISPKVQAFLDKEKIRYEVLHHPKAFTAQEIAGAQHVPGIQMLKTVIVQADGRLVMCILPSTHLLDLKKARTALVAKDLFIASEDDLEKLFPEYDLGAEPPFGHLYGLDVYAEKLLLSLPNVIFNAGTLTDTVKMRTSDFLNIINPTLVEFGKHI